MNRVLKLLSTLHTATSRDYVGRMTDDKVACMRVAREYGPDYWDGDRRYGYGGYRYLPGRWEPAARGLIDEYGLTPASKILDVGCGKGYLLYEIQLLLPGVELYGLDISRYALDNAHPELVASLREGSAHDLPHGDESFDLAISLMTLHNLGLSKAAAALSELARVARRSYVAVESYRDESELFNLECWALTAETLLRPEEWNWLFRQAGYAGEAEFLFFE